jgi:hypothetical protein
MTSRDQDMEWQDKVIGLLFRLRWIEHNVRSVRHDAEGCEIEAWVGLPGESLQQGTVFRAAPLSRCIDLGMAATVAR